MPRLLEAMCLVAVAVAFTACSESEPTEPPTAPARSAAADLTGTAAASRTFSCTVTQVDATHYAATASWSAFSVTDLKFFNGTTLLAQSVFHSTRNGTVTDTLPSAPTIAEFDGKTLGARTPCSTTA